MYIELKCNSCGKIFNSELSDGKFRESKCPICEADINYIDNVYIDLVKESLYENLGKLRDVSIIGIHPEDYFSIGLSSTEEVIFNSDINNIVKLYREGSDKRQEILSAIMDKFYLLISRDANTDNISELASTYENLSELLRNKQLSNNMKLMENIE